jgi:transposase
MAEAQEFILERVDDIPLLLGMMMKMQMPIILDKHLGNHGHQQGLSNGWVATMWLSYILSEGQHTKSSVQAWALKRRHLLEQVSGQVIRAEDFSDDSLSLLLKRLSDMDRWQRLEAELWSWQTVVHEIPLESVRLDSTTSYGYHTIEEDGLMQQGHSKDHRPELAQVKLMFAVAEPSGQLIACDVHSGERADDPLYLPLIERVGRITRQRGLLYTGDSKMAALPTRASIVQRGDYYLTVLPRSAQTAQLWDSWLDAIIEGPQSATLVVREGQLLAGGYEFTRSLSSVVTEEPVAWHERVLLVRSLAHAQAETQALEKRLTHAQRTLQALTPPPTRGRRSFQEEATLQAAIDKVLEQYQVAGLLQVTWQREETTVTRLVGPGRAGPQRPTRPESKVRYTITAVQRAEVALLHHLRRVGWRAYVTNLPAARWGLSALVCHYRAGTCVERDFHLLKARPLGLSPLYVYRPAQITGLTHLLTLALRVLLLLETTVREGLRQSQQTLIGLYEGQPTRATDRPTALRLLRAFARAEISRIGIPVADQWQWRLTPLSDLLRRILALAGLPDRLYLQLGNSP